MKNGDHGQVTLEFGLATGLILIPLILGGSLWFSLELNRSKCAYQAFSRAREQLILTQRAVDTRVYCDPITQTLHLENLEALDLKKNGLDLKDMVMEASALWEELSSSLPRSQGSDCTESCS